MTRLRVTIPLVLFIFSGLLLPIQIHAQSGGGTYTEAQCIAQGGSCRSNPCGFGPSDIGDCDVPGSPYCCKPLPPGGLTDNQCQVAHNPASCTNTCDTSNIADVCTGGRMCCRNAPPGGGTGGGGTGTGSGGTTPAPDTDCPADTTYVALTNSCISVDEFNNFLFILLVVAGALVAIYRATAGFFMFITAEGNPEKLKNGREALTQAMVGLLIVVGGWVLIRVVETLLPSMWNIMLTGA